MRKVQDNLFEAICSKENLILVWRRVENSYQHGDVWFDELEISAFKFNLVQNIERLSKQMKNGNYKMKPIKPAPYPKGMKVSQNDEGQETTELRVRHNHFVSMWKTKWCGWLYMVYLDHILKNKCLLGVMATECS